jgi:hypothetical protein
MSDDAYVQIKKDIAREQDRTKDFALSDQEEVLKGLQETQNTNPQDLPAISQLRKTHQGLIGRIPLEVCRIPVEGKNKWKGLV